MRAFGHIVLSAVLLLPLCGCGRGRVIPRDEMAQIYADMFIADEWLRDNPRERRNADTSLFYEPVFRKYGYTFKDYNASVRKYIRKPEKFSEILDEACSILKDEAESIRDVMAGIEAAKAFNARIKGYENKNFDSLLNYELSKQVQLFFGRDSDYFEHPVDSIESGRIDGQGDSLEVLFTPGPDDTTSERHGRIGLEISRKGQFSEN